MAQTNTLYVLLHGSICLVDKGTKASDDQAFAAHLLDQGDAHTYMCGPFLAEQELKPNGTSPMNLHFTGIMPGTAVLDPRTNPVVKLLAVPSATSGALAIVTLPRPQNIFYHLCGDINPTTLSDPQSRFQQPPSTLSAVKILEYPFDDFTKVALVDNSGKTLWSCPPPVQVGNKLVTAVHIYDEPPATMPMQAAAAHNVKEFNDCIAFLQVTDIKISAPAIVNPQPRLKPVEILGWEVAALDFRNSVGTINHVDRLRGDGAAGDPLGGGGGTQVCGVPDAAVAP
jgi:hypothetical protein